MTIYHSNWRSVITVYSWFAKGIQCRAIIMCLNLHNQFDLSGISTPTLWLSVSLRAATLPCSHSRSEAVFSSLVSFSSQSHNSTVKSVFAMLATSHKEAFVERIHGEIIQISCAQLGLCVLAVYIWKREKNLHTPLCSVSWSLWKARFWCCRRASVWSTWNADHFPCMTRASCVS